MAELFSNQLCVGGQEWLAPSKRIASVNKLTADVIR